MASLADIARDAGIIGAGGAGFPTHVKLLKPVGTIIMNGAECEPLMFGDQFVMETYAELLLRGARLVLEEFNASLDTPARVVICLKRKYERAIEAIRSGIRENEQIEIFELDNIYPSGDEQYLVYEVTGRIVPEGGIPPMVDALVSNVGTLMQLAEAADGKPVTDRYITIGGEVDNPSIAKVPIGAPFSEIIPMAGPKADDYVILVNGPMMGRITTNLDEVTTKTMGGLFLLPKRHSFVSRMSRPLSTEIRISKGVCEACEYCTDFCPRYLQGHALEPHKIMRVINYDRDLDTATITQSALCCECGICDHWACPMALSPRVIYKEFKKRLAEQGIKNPHNRSELTIDEHRQYRGTPTDRLTARLGLTEYDHRPPVVNEGWDVSSVRITLDQHIGAPSQPVVDKGDRVNKGQLIADIPKDALGARYHASIDGKVKQVTDRWIAIER